MKVMCLNGWGGKLANAMLPYLEAADPDVLCLQEVIRTPDAPADHMIYRDGATVLDQRSNVFGNIARALPHHVAIFCPAARGALWHEGIEYPSYWGLATYVRESIPIIAQAQDFVHLDYAPHGYGDHPRSRSAHAVRLYDYVADRVLTAAHMHGLRDPAAGKTDTPERRAQAERFADLVTRVAREGDGVIACGDFNVLPGSETFEVLGGIGLSDLVQARGVTSTRTSHYPKDGRFADYMAVNACLMEADFEVVTDPEVSDHCPLILTTD